MICQECQRFTCVCSGRVTGSSAFEEAVQAATRAHATLADPANTAIDDLSISLRVAVGRGDPVEVAMYCAFLHLRGARIEAVPKVALCATPNHAPLRLSEILAQVDKHLAQKEQRKKGRRSPERVGGRRKSD